MPAKHVPQMCHADTTGNGLAHKTRIQVQVWIID